MIVDELIHLFLSLLAGSVGFLIAKNWKVFVVAIFAGFFIDSDHFIDYFIYTKSLSFNFTEFFSGLFFDSAGKVYLFFHAYEYAIVAVVIAIILTIIWRKALSKRRLFTIGMLVTIALSLSLHLVFDTLSNKPDFRTYFITYRIAHNFDHEFFNFMRAQE